MTPYVSLSFFSDFFGYIKDTFFTVNTGSYENIDAEGLEKLPFILLGLTIGVIIASVSMVFTKRVLGNFIRRLISDGCFDEAGAKTLAELGFDRNAAVRYALRSNAVVKKYVRVACDDETKNGKTLSEIYRTDIDSVRFFIDNEESGAADRRFDKKGSNFLSVVIIAAIMIVASVAIIKLLPWFLGIFDGILGSADKPDIIR